MTSKPELLIFDLGRVLVDFDFHKAIRELARFTSKTEAQIQHYFETTPLWDAYERGRLNSQEFFAQLTRDLDLQGLTYEAFQPLWCDIFDEKHDSVALLKSLKGKYRLAMLSNVNEMHWLHIRSRHAFMHWFDIPVASYAVGLRKPEADIYHHVLKQAGVPPHKARFTDDVEAHIDAARDLGITAHQFTTADQLARDWADVFA